MTELDALLRAPWRFSLLRALAVLDRATQGPPIGAGAEASHETVRLRHEPSMRFAPDELKSVARVDTPEDDPRGVVYEVSANLLGVAGAAGPVPGYLAEEVLLHDDTGALRAMLDVFHHRLLGLLYRLAVRGRPDLGWRSDLRDPWSLRALSLAGVDLFEPRETLLSARQSLRLAPLLASRARSAGTVALALQDIFADELGGATLTLEAFSGRWVTLDPSDRVRLGVARHCLGKTLILGTRVFDRSSGFRVRIEGLREQTFRRLLPDGDLAPRFRAVIDELLDAPLHFDLDLTLDAQDRLPWRLGTARLGRDAWLGAARTGPTRRVVSADEIPALVNTRNERLTMPGMIPFTAAPPDTTTR